MFFSTNFSGMVSFSEGSDFTRILQEYGIDLIKKTYQKKTS